MMTRKRASVLLASIIVLVMLLLPLAGCTGGSSAASDTGGTPIPTIPQLQQQLTNMQGQLNELTSEVATLKAQSTPVDLTAINNQLATMQSELTSLAARVTALETPASHNSSGTTADTTRWHFRTVSLPEAAEEINAYIYDIDPSRIDDEGIYDIELVIENTGAVALVVDSAIVLSLVPDDYVAIDIDSVYLDSDDFPWLDWEEDFILRDREGIETCRRITFDARKHNFGVIEPDGYIILNLVFELYYA